MIWVWDSSVRVNHGLCRYLRRQGKTVAYPVAWVERADLESYLKMLENCGGDGCCGWQSMEEIRKLLA